MASVGAGLARQRSEATVAPSWDMRLYDGLRIRRVPAEARNELTHALGEVGVEAEFLLVLVDSAPGAIRPTARDGDLFLQRLAASLTRLVDASATLEVATQGYLTALEAGYPGVAFSPDEVWWPPFNGYTLRGDSLEARLRRCGYAWRFVVESRLPVHMEAILEQLALTLYALASLPPAGAVPVSMLYHGLYALPSALHGDITPRHILSGSGDPRYPGALASIRRLRELNASGDSSLDGDIAWARAQYAAISGPRGALDVTRLAQPPQATQMAQATDGRLLAAHAAYEWGSAIGFMESLRRRG